MKKILSNIEINKKEQNTSWVFIKNFLFKNKPLSINKTWEIDTQTNVSARNCNFTSTKFKHEQLSQKYIHIWRYYVPNTDWWLLSIKVFWYTDWTNDTHFMWIWEINLVNHISTDATLLKWFYKNTDWHPVILDVVVHKVKDSNNHRRSELMQFIPKHIQSAEDVECIYDIYIKTGGAKFSQYYFDVFSFWEFDFFWKENQKIIEPNTNRELTMTANLFHDTVDVFYEGWVYNQDSEVHREKLIIEK